LDFFDSLVTRRQARTSAQGSACQTTLLDVMATLQTVVKPAEDDLVVAIVVRWLRSGRITFLGNMTEAA
jgi:hypothetical protein